MAMPPSCTLQPRWWRPDGEAGVHTPAGASTGTPANAPVVARTIPASAPAIFHPARRAIQPRTFALNLTVDDVAAAEAVGCSFHTLPAAQHSRFAMQRKLFQIDGRAVLATRGGGLHETAATLSGLLEVGRERLRSALAAAVPRSPATPDAPMTMHAAACSGESGTGAPPEAPEGAGVVPDLATEPRMRRAARPRATREGIAARVEQPPDQAEAAMIDAMPQADAHGPVGPRLVRLRRAREPRELKWMTAGADRRGRAAVHWTTRVR
jgi:hypothetical protein